MHLYKGSHVELITLSADCMPSWTSDKEKVKNWGIFCMPRCPKTSAVLTDCWESCRINVKTLLTKVWYMISSMSKYMVAPKIHFVAKTSLSYPPPYAEEKHLGQNSVLAFTLYKNIEQQQKTDNLWPSFWDLFWHSTSTWCKMTYAEFFRPVWAFHG